MKFDPESFLNGRFVGEGGWTLGGRGGGHNRGEVNKIFVDNSKMVMYCQRTAKTCEGNEIASILMLPQQSFNSGIGKDKKLTAAKATLLCSLTSRTTPPLPPPIHSLSYKIHDPSVNYVTTQAGMGEKLKNSISKFSKSLAEETER